MSGGVDSAVAAARAVDAGHDVVGVHLALSRPGGTLRAGSRGCCTIEDAMDARRAADRLGIPFYVWDFSERFRDDVIEDFVAEYSAGRTPNPCMRCNEKIKFAAVLEKALDLGFDAVCTGHYAILREGASGERELHRASDAAEGELARDEVAAVGGGVDAGEHAVDGRVVAGVDPLVQLAVLELVARRQACDRQRQPPRLAGADVDHAVADLEVDVALEAVGGRRDRVQARTRIDPDAGPLRLDAKSRHGHRMSPRMS